MKKPFDFLASDKNPIHYTEYAYVKQKNGLLVSVDKGGEEEIIPAASTLCLFMGPGTSITHDAARLCAENDCYVAVVNGGCNAHSIWHAGRWPSPERFVKQALVVSNPKKKLKAAKTILKHKFIKNNQESYVKFLKHAKTIEEIMGIEAAAAKSKYKELAEARNIDFRRDRSEIEGVNGRVSLLSNALYHYMTVLCHVYGVNPSMGFLHGTTRRGGLSFDLADIFKHDLVLVPAFDSEVLSSKDLLRGMAAQLKNGRSGVLKETFSIIDEVLG